MTVHGAVFYGKMFLRYRTRTVHNTVHCTGQGDFNLNSSFKINFVSPVPL